MKTFSRLCCLHLSKMDYSTGCFKFFWKLENFCFCNLYCNERLSSPTFKVSVPYQCDWTLYMIPNGYGIEKYVSIYLKRSKNDLGPREITAGFKISLIDTNGTPCPVMVYSEKIFTKDSEWGCNECIKRGELKANSIFIANDTLTILCNFTILHTRKTSGVISFRRPSIECQKFKETQSISSAMKSLYDNSQYSDITLNGNPKQFYVHKCILQTRLPTLYSKSKCRSNPIFANDLETEQILQYCYTGKFNFKDFHFVDARKTLNECGLAHVESRIFSHRNTCAAHTYFAINKHAFSWTVKTSQLNDEDDISSPLISDGCDKIAFMTFLSKSQEGLWKINIRVDSKDDVFVRCKISLRDNDDFREECEKVYRCRSDALQCDSSIQLVDGFLFINGKTVLCFYDYFTLDFIFTYPTGKMISRMDNSSSCYESFTNYDIDDTDKLLDDLEEMYREEHHADVSVQAGSKIFKVHKCILSMRSPVFRAMLMHDMLEKTEDLIPMKNDVLDDDLFAQVVDKLLLYTYCGKLEAPDPEFRDFLISLIDMYFIGENYDEMISG